MTSVGSLSSRRPFVSHELPLERALEAYEKFDKRVACYTKVIHPHA
jgi:hypothetical protein